MCGYMLKVSIFSFPIIAPYIMFMSDGRPWLVHVVMWLMNHQGPVAHYQGGLVPIGPGLKQKNGISYCVLDYLIWHIYTFWQTINNTNGSQILLTLPQVCVEHYYIAGRMKQVTSLSCSWTDTSTRCCFKQFVPHQSSNLVWNMLFLKSWQKADCCYKCLSFHDSSYERVIVPGTLHQARARAGFIKICVIFLSLGDTNDTINFLYPCLT